VLAWYGIRYSLHLRFELGVTRLKFSLALVFIDCLSPLAD
jgi:hypothetical protein